ncbi:MAG: hypothetical protein IJW54_05895, partial [Clostridia bacterium]|nr:hypothetical protein [Clostridia bacterium]
MRRRLIEEKIIRGVKSSVSCEKDELVLTESSGVAPDSIAIKGNTFQQIYEGYNLFNIDNYNVHKFSLRFDISHLVIGEKYTLSSNKPLSWFKISTDQQGYNSVIKYETTNGFTTFTFTMARNSNIEETSTQYLMLGGLECISGDSTWGVFTDISQLEGYEIQIVEGTEKKPNEPYVGGIPSPSPQYPQPIKSSNNIDLTLSGVNLFNYADTTATYKGVYTQLKKTNFAVKPNTKYTIRFDYEITENVFSRIMFSIGQGLTYYATDIEYGASLPNLTSGTFTYTFTTKKEETTEKYPYLFFRIRRPTSETGTVTMTISNLMVVEGLEAKPYEPYIEPTTINIPSEITSTTDKPILQDGVTLADGTVVPLRFARLDSSEDKLVVDGISKKVIYQQQIYRLIITGEETGWYKYQTADDGVRIAINGSNINPKFKPKNKSNNIIGFICNYLQEVLETTKTLGIAYYNNNDVYWWGINLGYPDLESTLNALKEYYVNGNPLCVQYRLQTPIEYDLTSLDIGQELLKIKLPKNTAIITAKGKNGIDIQGIDATYYTTNLENSDMQELIIECIDEQGNVIDAKYHLVRRDSVFKALAPKIEGYEA